MNYWDLHNNRKARLWFLVSVLALVVLASLYSLWRAAKANSLPETSKKPQAAQPAEVVVLDAEVVWSKQEFLVTNRDSRLWRQCKFEVNGQTFGDGYGALAQEVGSGKRATVPHSSFRKADGSAYDYLVELPNRFTIRCQDVNGKPGVYIGSATAR